MAENKKKDILQTKPPKAKTLNRKFIFMLLVIAAVLLFVALSSLFETPKKTSASNTLADQKLVDNNPALISQLPSSYADMKKMSKYVAGDKSDNTDKLSAEISSLRKELEALKKSKSTKSTVASKTSATTKSVASYNASAAKSSIFVKDGAPSTATNTPVSKLSSFNTSKTKAGTSADDSSLSSQLGFLSNDVNGATSTVTYSQSPYTLTPGTVVPAMLQTKVISSLPGNVVARVRRNVYDSLTGRHLLIPQGTILFGLYNSSVIFGQSQLQMVFTQMMRPDGATITLQNEQGIDSQGVAGLSDILNNHWGTVIGAAVLTTLFDLPSALVANNSDYNTSGSTVYLSTGTDSIGSGISQVGDQIVSRSLQVTPTVTLESGKMFNVMVSSTVEIPPYKVA